MGVSYKREPEILLSFFCRHKEVFAVVRNFASNFPRLVHLTPVSIPSTCTFLLGIS